jgi:ABC-type dipeptide/oligopeptide/nickel transport system permease component
MVREIGGLVFQAVVTLWVTTVVIFLLVRLTGSPVDVTLPDTATAEQRAAIVEQLGLDRSLVTQYWLYATRVGRGDLGHSYTLNASIGPLIRDRAWNTVLLATAATVLAVVLAVPLAVLAATRRGGFFDRAANVVALGGMSLPSFISGILAILVFGVWLRWFPIYGAGGWRHFVLPAATLGWFNSAGILRLLRSGLLEVLSSEYVKTARAKGLSEWLVLWKHALRNAALPVLTFLGLSYGILLAGAVTTEVVFAWPGLGSLVSEAIARRDFPVIQAVTLFTSAAIIVVNLAVDLLYTALDPRIRG